MAQRFDQRSLAVLCSQVGAIPLIAFGLVSDSFLIPGTRWVLALVGAFTLCSVALTISAGKLTDRQFALDGFGGMLGIAASAAAISDEGSGIAVLVLIAAIPALTAMASPQRLVISFVIAAMVLACAVMAARATTSVIALAVSSGAVLMAIAAPTIMVTMLRRTLSTLIDEQARLSITDPLTGAVNRRGLFDGSGSVFGSARRSGKCIAMLVIDIDHFKRINDAHGHAAGDATLIDVTTLLRDNVPDDALVARTGGEEFTVLTIVDGEAQLRDIAAQLCLTVHAHAGVTISIGGVTANPEELHDDDPTQPSRGLDRLVTPADHLLYAAKDLGRNRAVVSSLAEFSWRAASTKATRPGSAPTTPATSGPTAPREPAVPPPSAARGRGECL